VAMTGYWKVYVVQEWENAHMKDMGLFLLVRQEHTRKTKNNSRSFICIHQDVLTNLSVMWRKALRLLGC